MRVRKIMMLILGTICLTTIVNNIPILPVAYSLSTSSIPLDPVAENAQGWDNAWTETIFGDGTPPFKTIIYSRPQVVWNGTQWRKHEIKPINETAAILRTPTCSYLVGKLVVSLLDPQGTLHVGKMKWVVEQYSETLNRWIPKSVETTSIGYNGTHVWQKWTFNDKSERVLYIGNNNKQTITFTSKASAAYRIAWHLSDINATKVIYSNGTQANLEIPREISLTNFNSPQLTLYNKNKFSLLIDYSDIDRAYHREFALGWSTTGLVNINLTYGNWTVNSNESIVIDPETETFVSEAALDDTIDKWATYYPPNNVYVYEGMNSLVVGQDYLWPYFEILRSYVSFNTSSIRDYAVITNATLKLKTSGNSSDTDFVMKVMGGSQPIYGSNLEASDWNCGTTEVATWSSSQYPGDNVYINITIPPDQINVVGRTQFELKSNREGTQPSAYELVEFSSGELAESEPILKIDWIPPMQKIDGHQWYYWNSSTNEKAAIVLFGGGATSDGVYVYSLYTQFTPYYDKEKFVLDLCSNGFDVLSPKSDTYDTSGEDRTWWSMAVPETQGWVENASMWLVNEGYNHVFLFGFSAGGVVAAYEIQKDYASIYFSAAIIADAPVDCGGGYLFNTADTASAVKVATSFIVGENDTAFGNITEQMENYYDNTVVHKEWHLWEDGHDPFSNYCKTHSNPPENVSVATISWYNAAHPPNVPLRPSGPTMGAENISYNYWTQTIDVNDDNIHYQFDWDDNSTTTIGPYPSGANVSTSHTWSSPGTYYVKVRAKDSHGAWGGWSPSLIVDISTLTLRTHWNHESEISNATLWIDSVQYSSPVTIPVGTGTHGIEVESRFNQNGKTYVFDHWEDNSTENPRTINLTCAIVIKAYYLWILRLDNWSFEEIDSSPYSVLNWSSNNGGWRDLKSAVNGDEVIDGSDVVIVIEAIPSWPGHPNWNPNCDVNGDGVVDGADFVIVMGDVGKTAEWKDGSYSWYTSGGGNYTLSQWLSENNVNLTKGHQVTFAFWCKPETIIPNVRARAEIYYTTGNGTNRTIGGSWINLTNIEWYNPEVTITLPSDAATIKVIIHGESDFKAWVDKASMTIT